MDSYPYHATKRETVFATHCNPDIRRWGINRVAEAAAQEARARYHVAALACSCRRESREAR